MRPDNMGAAVGVAQGNNRVNSSGQAPSNNKGKTSLTINRLMAAGDALVLPVTGTSFYLQVATAPIQIRPTGNGVGVFNEYSQGTGLYVGLENTFANLELKNNNAFTVVVSIFIGFDGFIDNRLIIATTTTPLVAYPTYPTPNAAGNVNITDKSGSVIVDINGNEWYAIQREGMYIFNVDTGIVYLIQKFGSVVANGPAIGAVYPQTTLRLPESGNYCINVGGANINVIVSEVYQALPKTT